MNENKIDTLNENPVAPETQAPPSAEALPDPLQSAQDAHRLRNGKIAALPHDLREQLNLRLQRGEPAPPLLDWLNSQPEVLAVLKDTFDGVPISKQNLSAWRQGGYLEWQMRQELTLDADTLNGTAQEIEDSVPGVELANNLVTILTAHYARLLNHWDGEPDPKFEAKLLVLRRLSRDVALLQKCQLLAAEYEAGLEKQWRQDLDDFRWRRLMARLKNLDESENPEPPSPGDPNPLETPAESTVPITPTLPLHSMPGMEPSRKAQAQSEQPQTPSHPATEDQARSRSAHQPACPPSFPPTERRRELAPSRPTLVKPSQGKMEVVPPSPSPSISPSSP